MSEYWVSQAKFYCKFCNCYIADNKPSRQHHENGAKHKERVAQHMREKRDGKLFGARSEKDLKQQLADIEKAAKAAVAQDRGQHQGMFYENIAISSIAPAPPPPSFPMNLTTEQLQKIAELKAADEDPENLQAEMSGVYTVKDKTYLDGKMFEEKLRNGCKCEIFVEELDEWFPVKSLTRIETPVPNTTVTINTFDVVYSVVVEHENSSSGSSSVGEEKELERKESGIKSDRFRIVADSKGNAIVDGVVVPKVVQETGLGMWQTVTVREVDEVKEREEYEKLRDSELYSNQQEDVSFSSKGNKRVFVKPEDGDDSAMSAYDPYQQSKKTKVYKGITLYDPTQEMSNELESISEGVNVQFKKRKKVNRGNPVIKSEV